MVFNEINPKLQLSLDEYVETWSSIILDYYWRGLASDITDKELRLSDEALLSYSMELAAIELIIAVRVLKNRIRLTEELGKKVSEAVVKKFYSDIQGADKSEYMEEFIKFFNSKYSVFNEICTNLTDKDAKKRQPELIGMARYLVAQVSDRPEKQNVKAIEKLSLLFIDTAASCLRLAKNSAVENPMLGRVKFIVQK